MGRRGTAGGQIKEQLDSKSSDIVVSSAPCADNCLAPLTKVMPTEVGIVEDPMTMVHAMMAMQLTEDGPSRGGKAWRGGRCASQSTLPSSTGAARAVGKGLSDAKDKRTGMAICGPTSDVSAADLMWRLETPAEYKGVGAAVKEAAAEKVTGGDAQDQKGMNVKMCELDGTPSKGRPCVDMVPGVSPAAAKAAAEVNGVPPY